jgi:cell division protein FtsL
MAAVAQEARSRRPSSPVARRRPRQAVRRRLAGGVVWIALVAALLAGAVAVNVAVLKLNMRYDDLGQARARLQSENAALASKLAGAASAARIEQAAARQGLRPAEPPQTTFLNMDR